MKLYTIKSQVSGEEIRTLTTCTRKREIESMFNRIMKSFDKDSNYIVERVRMGYSKVTFYGMFGHIETEYWIARS